MLEIVKAKKDFDFDNMPLFKPTAKILFGNMSNTNRFNTVNTTFVELIYLII